MRAEYVKMLQELLELPEAPQVNLKNMSENAIVLMMACERLDRIADSLEKLSGCVRTGPGVQYIKADVTGAIKTYNQ